MYLTQMESNLDTFDFVEETSECTIPIQVENLCSVIVFFFFDKDAWKGMFDNEEEREFFLTESVKAIHNRIKEVKK